MRFGIGTWLVVTAAVLAATNGGAVASPVAHVAARQCGSLYDSQYQYKVTAKRVSCKFARRIVRSYRVNLRRGWRSNGGDSLASRVWTSKRYPGWGCGDGSGGGLCFRGSKSAGWEIPPRAG